MITKIILAALMLSAFALPLEKTENGSLMVKITNIKTTGKVRVGLYRDGGDFPDPNKLVERKIIDCKDSCFLQFSKLHYGDYAIALFQDENGNEKLDKNFVGIPTEPFAFSNNFRPKFGGPPFEKCSFSFSADKQVVEIKMINSLFGGD